MSRKAKLWIFFSVLAITLPFLGKSFHIDDTFVLRVSEQVLSGPFDPFAGTIDWFGHEKTVWEATTNPPLLSYYLAPFAWLSEFSESVLHLAMIPFFLLLAWGMGRLSNRFLGGEPLAVLYVLLGPAVMVSGNVMRDVPAVGLTIAGMALFIDGIDGNHKKFCVGGSLLVGLGILTKYSAGVLLGVLILYPLLKRRVLGSIWVLLPASLLGAWCVYTEIVYGQAHPLYLLLERSSNSGIVWQDKGLMALAILGSCLFLGPVLLVTALRSKKSLQLCICLFVVVVLVSAGIWFYGELYDAGIGFWVALGAVLLTFALITGALCRTQDSVFLLCWFLAPLVFSIFFVPFQAVRHLIPALPPLVLILFCYLKEEGFGAWKHSRAFLIGFLMLQVLIGFSVQFADYEYAASYQSFAEDASHSFGDSPVEVWYVGHWGWKFYADKYRFRQLHRDGVGPEEGDLLIWPEKVHIGDVFDGHPDLRDRLELLTGEAVHGAIPVRTMNMAAKASFYAVIKGRLPYRFEESEKVEEFRVYRVLGKE